ncbi:MAG: type II secretion system protein GspL [Lautropia sp.]
MATPQLKKHQAVVWLPPRSAGERAFGSEALLLAHVGGAPRPTLRRASLDSLEGVRQVWLIADARDVSLLDVTLPPLSGARLRQALPNVVEEFLLQDVSKCLIVPGPASADGKRLIGVVDRDWVEFVVGAFARRQMKVDALWPAQLALPLAADQWSLACAHDALALRTGPGSGLGWNAGEDPDYRAEAIVAILEAGAASSVKPAKLKAYLEDGEWQRPVQKAAQRCGMVVEMARLPLVRTAAIDLLLGRASGMKAAMAQFDWRRWRAPAALATACVVASLIGLNVHWALQSTQKQAMRQSMEQKFRAAFPGTQAVVDPVLQMKRNVAALRAQSGRAGPDDFVPLAARFAQAMGPKSLDSIAALEYREGELKVRFNPGAATGQGARDGLRQSAARLGLKLQFDNERDLTAKVTVQGT